MNAELQPLVSVLRVFPDDGKYGDPYGFCATVRHLDPKTVEIIGAMRAPKPSEWRAIRDCLRKAKADTAIFTRIKNGCESAHYIRLPKRKRNRK